MQEIHNLIAVAKLLALLLIAVKTFRFFNGKGRFTRIFVAVSGAIGNASRGLLQRWAQQLPKHIKLRYWQRIKPLLPKEHTQHLNDPFDPMFTLLWLSQKDPLRVSHAMEGIHIFGGTGSGKTSGSGMAVMKAFMRAGWGGLMLTTKPDDIDLIRRCAARTGRSQDLIVFEPSGPHRFNFLAYEQRRPGGGITSNIVKLFTVIQEATERGNSAGAKEEIFWKNSQSQLLRNVIDLLLIARPRDNLSVMRMYDVIMSAPRSPNDVESEVWQRGSLCYQLLEEALANAELTPRQQSDLKITGRYWLQEFANLPHDTRGSIVSMFTSIADSFLRGPIGELFSTTLTVVPDLTLENGIIVLNLPTKVWGQVGLASQVLWKLMWQQCVERRDVKKNPRPTFLWVDEAHNFCNSLDVEFQTTARSSRACTVYLSQVIANYHWSLGEQAGKSLATSLFSCLGTKIFHANSDFETNQFAAETFAKSWQQKSQSGINNSSKGGGTTAGFSDSLEFNILPAEFVTLRKGGAINNYMVDAIVSGNGRVFRSTGSAFLRTTFRQER